MKFITLTLAVLLGESSAVSLGSQYATAEGPTKVDYGEHDEEATVIREDRFKNGWENPLSWTDSGNDDDKILAQLNKPACT